MTPKRITIMGQEYELTPLGARTGRRLWLKILHLIAEPLKVLGASGSKLDETVIIAAITAAIENLDDETHEALIAAFGPKTRVFLSNGNAPTLDHDSAVFDTHFAQNYARMSAWLLESVIFNFAGFFGDTSLGNLSEMLKAAVSRRASPTDSTGSSGES